ncbi:acyl homoserine lactone synthase [Erwinia toletana]|uniref:Acyl-homoserine-lactone synthase n=1 Tax=Winslowiella toletana TaxID=92490 RepID=E0WH57_9GAMM|nr:acyl-homoserine-lactone synthase [Winslowiella toletana]MBP2171506.1 acyl homoserine lactone synthase [Winslowiella toletana]CBM41478.1 N-acyl homoserine lactone synthase [Winslowiella toletana DAPP-PG 735]
MLEIFDVSFDMISNNKMDEMFTLRKGTFKDRLNWAVKCTGEMEFDEYDGQHTNYLLGIKDESLVCSVRFIEMQYPNMIDGTFSSFFKDVKIPQGNYIESSRFFVDRTRAKNLNPGKNPVAIMLFLAMVNYAQNYHYDGILTIVSHPMLTILKRSGWGISVISQGISEKDKPVYLLHLPVDKENQQILIDRINQHNRIGSGAFNKWPLALPLIKERVE